MKISARLRKPKSWWPVGLFVLCGIALGIFQNCSNVGFDNPSGSNRAQNVPDTPDAPAHFPPVDPIPPRCTQISQNIQPALMWDWYSQLGAGDYHSFNQVMSSPVVGDLNGSGHPSVVFVSWSTNPADHFNPNDGQAWYSRNGVLRIVDGATGRNKVSVGAEALAPFATMVPLLIDLDSDGKMEIVYVHYNFHKIIALNSDGSFRWSWTLPNNEVIASACDGGLAAVDTDLNGRPEIIVGNYLIEEGQFHLLSIKKTLNPLGSVTCLNFATVLDPAHPHFSIVEPSGVYNNDGIKQFSLSPGFGFVSVGKVRSDLVGNQLIKTGNQRLQIFDGINGTMLTDIDLLALSQFKCPGGQIGGGPPSIGDFLGNGTFQIAVATGQYLMIFDGRGNVLASYHTQDCSSLSTGVTAFDFDGDGKPEILYGDEEYFRIFHVVNGQLVVVAKIVNPSGTLIEYPVVADIVGDGASKLLVVGNNYAVGSFYQDPGEAADIPAAQAVTGIRAFKSADGLPWMPTRASWNQYSYNASLVNDHGRVFDPAVSSQSWLGKTFKLNAQVTMTQPICQK